MAKRTPKALNDNYSPSAVEEAVSTYWKENKIFEKSVDENSNKESYSFYDGPPFVTGLPHYGHLLGSIIKDVVPRFHTMKGKKVRRVWGWDCHGLPAENKVEKKLGINSKKEIEILGVDKFVAECKAYVNDISSEWEWYVDRIGRWVDMKHAYKTMDLPYMESVMWVFSELYKKDRIYKGKRVSLFCPRCSTPLTNFEIAMDNSYKDVSDPSVFVKFKLIDREESILAWTTTPWTLPTNFALGINPDETYVTVEVEGEKLILAKSRVAAVFGDTPHHHHQEFQGRTLVGLSYEPLYNYYPAKPQDHQVYAADFVSMDDGTGVVHIAPGFGEDDTALGLEHDLSMVESVDEEGKLDPKIEVAQGFFFKKADKYILEDLTSKKKIYKLEKIVHSYPHCWRCGTPLLYMAQDAWYLKIQDVKDDLLKSNQKINWVPDYFKDGRFKLGIDSAPDWCISRTRYWGSPLPVWECTCGQRFVPGSISELEKASNQKIADLHRPAIDEVIVKCQKCGKDARRVKEVLDCWLESASMPYGERHYPFENKAEFEKNFPADFITEYTAQLRAWFYVCHVISNQLFQSNAFKNVIVTGVIQGNDGRKMSKNFGNYPDPKDSLIKYGADSLRLYLMGSPIVVGQDIAISENDWQEQLRSVLMILFNSYKFFTNYASLEKIELPEEPDKAPTLLDQWILTRLDETVLYMNKNLEEYNLQKAVGLIKPFVNDLSTWYIRRSRDRVGPSATNLEDKMLCYTTLNVVFEVLFRTIAPITPFISEFLYRHQTGKESVHLQDYPSVLNESVINKDLLVQMELVRKICELGHSQRKSLNIAVKQALNSATVSGADALSDKSQLVQLIKDELNIENVIFIKSDELTVVLDQALDERLIAKGEARQIMRAIQEARKESACRLDEMIELVLPSWPKLFESEIKQQTLVSKITKGDKLTVIRNDQ